MYTEFIFEAAYIAVTGNLFENPNPCMDKHTATAAMRILEAFQITTLHKAQEFMAANNSGVSINGAKNLYTKIMNPHKTEFFASLDEASLHVYHCCNYEVSYQYGRNLARNIGFDNSIVFDIGGSSGGLLCGIKSVYPHTKTAVFDTASACEAGKTIGSESTFIEWDFFRQKFPQKSCNHIILSNILHDWDDDNCGRMLANMVNLFMPHTKLIIHEDVLLPDGFSPIETVIHGLRLCVNVVGGRQRNEDELLALVKNANPNAKLEQKWNYGAHTALVISF